MTPAERAFADALGHLLADAVWRELTPDSAKPPGQDGFAGDEIWNDPMGTPTEPPRQEPCCKSNATG